MTVNLAPAVLTEIRALVDRGLYESPEQFLEIAAFNQLSLERGTKPEVIVKDGALRGTSSPKRVSGAPQAPQPLRASQGRRGSGHAPVRTPKSKHREAPEVPVEETLARFGMNGVRDTQHPAPCHAEPRPEQERLWGQVNRLLPLKLSCRWILVRAGQQGAWSPLESLVDAMAKDSAAIGTYLEALDDAAQRKREEVLSTGLPRQGNIASMDRFASQFIARTTRAGDIYPGAICQYALARFDGDRLGLTDRGVELARLSNPILDSDPKQAVTTLSVAERDFLVEQVKAFVPGELSDFRLILAAVAAGRSTPEDLLIEVRGSLPETWSEVMTRTHVSGVIARLAELDLLRRRWEGSNVNYELGRQVEGLAKR